jgi:hypothetical protein
MKALIAVADRGMMCISVKADAAVVIVVVMVATLLQQ